MPALIVLVIVLVVTLFGAVAGHEATPRENLDRMLHGTANDRQQASFSLVRQVLADLHAVEQGQESEWDVDRRLLGELRRAWEDLDEEGDVQYRYVLAVLMARVGDGDDVVRLASLLELPPGLDPDGEIRFRTVASLGMLGPGMDGPSAERAARAIIPLLEGEDGGLRTMAAAALQNLPSPGTAPALQGALADGNLATRGSAAISLTYHGDPSGVEVLLELIDPQSYGAERQSDPELWIRGQDVSESRCKAVEALGRLGRDEDRATLERLAEGEEDLNVREAALRALANVRLRGTALAR